MEPLSGEMSIDGKNLIIFKKINVQIYSLNGEAEWVITNAGKVAIFSAANLPKFPSDSDQLIEQIAQLSV